MTVTLREAQAKLLDLIHQLSPGDEVLITENDQAVARLTPAVKPADQPHPQPRERQLGTLKGTVLYMAPDFDAPLEDFKEYME